MSDQPSLTPFPHRCNDDGTWDAICPHCHLTIATRMNEADLRTVEIGHDCQLYAVERGYFASLVSD